MRRRRTRQQPIKPAIELHGMLDNSATAIRFPGRRWVKSITVVIELPADMLVLCMTIQEMGEAELSWTIVPVPPDEHPEPQSIPAEIRFMASIHPSDKALAVDGTTGTVKLSLSVRDNWRQAIRTLARCGQCQLMIRVSEDELEEPDIEI